MAPDAADHRAAGDLRAGRERRRRRHRRRAGAGLQDGEPQPSLLHRALPGGGDRGRRHPARRLHHGGAADRGDERAELRPSRRIRRPGRWCTAWSRGSAATAMPSGCRRSAASCGSTPPTTATAWSTPLPPGSRRPTRIFYSAASGVGMPVVYLGAKTGRDGVGGATMASAEFDDTHRGEAADGAGRRPLHREAADGGMPRADGDRGGDLDPGHGRGRADLLGGRDGRQGGSRDPARPRPGAGARARDDRLRDDAEREPGADADGAASGEGGGGAGGVRQVGSRLRHRRRDDRGGPLHRAARRRGEGGPAAEGAVGGGAGVRPAVGRHPCPGAARAGAGGRSGGGAARADREPELLRAGLGLVAVRPAGDGGHGRCCRGRTPAWCGCMAPARRSPSPAT